MAEKAILIIGILSLILGIIFISIPLLFTKPDGYRRYLYFFYGPAYILILTAFYNFYSVWITAPSYIDLIFLILYLFGLFLSYRLAKKIDNERRAAGEIE